MFVRRFTLTSILILATASALVCFAQQDFPTRPIRIVTSQPGGGNDIGARLLAPGLSARLGQPVVVENRGGSVSLQAGIVARATDGYTLLIQANPAWLYPFMTDKAPYDPIRDLAAVTVIGISPLVMVIHPSLAATTVKEFIALAQAKPGELNYAYGGSPGGSTHLAGELFTTMTGVKILQVPYKGTAFALTDLISGRVHMMFSTGPAGPHIKAGRLRALAVTSAQPSALFPGLPTVAASGVPDYEAVNILGLFGTAKMSAATLRRLNHEAVAVLSSPEAKEKYLSAGIEVIASSPQESAAAIKADTARWGKIIKTAGIRSE